MPDHVKCDNIKCHYNYHSECLSNILNIQDDECVTYEYDVYDEYDKTEPKYVIYESNVPFCPVCLIRLKEEPICKNCGQYLKY